MAIQDSDLTFNGVHAENLAQFKPQEFASDPHLKQQMSEDAAGPEGRIAAFGKKISTFLATPNGAPSQNSPQL